MRRITKSCLVYNNSHLVCLCKITLLTLVPASTRGNHRPLSFTRTYTRNTRYRSITKLDCTDIFYATQKNSRMLPERCLRSPYQGQTRLCPTPIRTSSSRRRSTRRGPGHPRHQRSNSDGAVILIIMFVLQWVRDLRDPRNRPVLPLLSSGRSHLRLGTM